MLPAPASGATLHYDVGSGGENPLFEQPSELANVILGPWATITRGAATDWVTGASAVYNGAVWQQVDNLDRRWRQIRTDTGLDWVTPHTFRKTVATLISERVDAEAASRQLGHSSPAITRSSTSPSRRSRPTSRTCSKNWLVARMTDYLPPGPNTW